MYNLDLSENVILMYMLDVFNNAVANLTLNRQNIFKNDMLNVIHLYTHRYHSSQVGMVWTLSHPVDL